MMNDQLLQALVSSEQANTQLLEAMTELAMLLKAPRRRTLIFDPQTGRAIGSIEEIILPAQPALPNQPNGGMGNGEAQQ